MKKKAFIKSGIVVASLVIASMFGFSTAFGYGGGGGGYTPTNYCTSVSYGEWGPNANGFQYRNVTAQSPTGCSLTTSQQIARSRAYVAETVITPVAPAPVVVAPVKQVLGEKKYADGTLIRYKGDSKIYVIVNGEKQHIKTLAELRKHAGKKILTVTSDVPEVLGEKKYANGTLIKAKGDTKIYVIKDGKKMHIKSLAELRTYKGKTLTVEVSELNNY